MIKQVALSGTNEELAEILKPLWGMLTVAQQEELKEKTAVKRYHKNSLIYHEGEEPRAIMCAITGKVKVYKDGINGRQQIVRVFKPGQLFAFRAHFAHQNYLTKAVALENSIILEMPCSLADKLVKTNSKVASYFIKILSEALGDADTRTINLTQKHIRARLADALLFLKKNYGLSPEGWLDVDMSREDIACLANMTTSNAIRTLSALTGEGLVTTKGKKIRIDEAEQLQHIAKMG